MWIFCCGMIRSGSTLQYQLVSEIIRSKNIGKSLGWTTPQDFQDLYQRENDETKILVVKSHDFIAQATQLSNEGKAKFVYSYRDIRDVIISIAHKYDKSFLGVIRAGHIEPALENYEKWNALTPILSSKYEILSKDIKHELVRICEFIDVDLDELELDRIAGEYTIDKQRQRIMSTNYGSSGIQSGGLVYSPETLLYQNHINSGESELWQHVLPRLECGIIESLAESWLLSHDYPLSQNYLYRNFAKILYRTSIVQKASKRIHDIRQKLTTLLR